MLIHSAVITGSVQLNNTDVSGITNVAGFATTASLNTLIVRTGSYATTGSNQFNGNQSISGSITSNGTITAQTLVVQTVTSSIDYVTGSSINGSLLANTHQFTGSVSVTGSLAVNESNVILTNQTSSMSVATASYWSGSILNAESSSYALTASYALNGGSGGGGVGFPFSGSAIITGSLFVSGSTISGSFVGDGSGITGLTAGGKIHTQSSAVSTWTVTHNLGVQYPNVTIYNSSNEIIIPQTITATDANTLTLTFGSAVAGYAVAGIGGIINVQGRTTQQYFTASTTWSFAHNLGDKYVSLQAFDDAFEMMIPTTIRLVDFTSSLLLFDSASSGYAVATIGGDLPAISSSYAGYTLQVASSAPYSASWVAVPDVTITNAVSSSFAATASSADNLTVRGTLTAQTINVQTITSSIDFVTGSAKFGSLSTNTHQFTGSVLMTGSVYMSGGTLQVGGTTEPGKISLFQSDTKTYSASTSNDADLFIVRVNPSAISNQIASLQLVSSGNNGSNAGRGIISVIQTNQAISSGDIAFQNNNAGTIAERMRITSSGSIGIGTSSPEGPLHISGSNAGGYIGMAITNYNGAAGTSVGIDFGVDQSSTYNGGGNGQILVTSTGGAATTYRSEMLLKTWDGSSLLTSIKISDTGRVSFPAATAQSYGVSNATAVTVNTATPTTIASVTITTTGKPVLLVASGDGNPDQAGGWHNLRLYRDSTPVGKLIISENAGGSSANCPFALTHIDTPSAGTYTYTVKAWQGNASFTYGETGNDQAPTLCVVELL